MAKGSQLSQLKTALNKVGVTGNNPSSNSRKRKRSVSTNKDKEKQARQLDAIHKRFNAFDVRETKLKHQVLGKGKIKGQRGAPTKSRQAGLDSVWFFCLVILRVAELVPIAEENPIEGMGGPWSCRWNRRS
jgi:nucleolar protein 14